MVEFVHWWDQSYSQGLITEVAAVRGFELFTMWFSESHQENSKMLILVLM